MLRRAAAAVLIIFIITAFGPAARAQTISGIIAGTVRDPQDKPLRAVTITAKNPQSGRQYPASTNAEGYFRILEVPPGYYVVQADLGGFQTIIHTNVRVNVNRTTIEDFSLQVQTKEESKTEVSRAPMTNLDSPTLSTAFPEKQITELPILTRDVNNLALLAPGTLSVRTFSFASTLVPFAVNGSRGRDNNFIIDSVDNNEPLFGGAASQFTNTDIFAEYTILTSQLKAEFGRNSGATINAITKSGSNNLHGTIFWFGQDQRFNALTNVERTALLSSPPRFYENQAGITLGGPIKKDKTFFFTSYQWDRGRDDLSDVFPVLATLADKTGLADLLALPSSPALNTLLNIPSVKTIPGLSAPCFRALPPVPPAPPPPAPPPVQQFSLTNPCFINSTLVMGTGLTAGGVPFNVFRVPRGNLFDVRDHQFSGRVDHRLNNSNDVYVRYLFDDLLAPRIPLAPTGEIAFSDLGLLPDWRLLNMQRTQSLLLNHRYQRIISLNELRFSYSRVSQNVGPFNLPRSVIEKQASTIITDNFGAFGATFPAAGNRFTIGRDSKPSLTTSNVYQIQDNLSLTRGKHSLKFGANFARVESNIRSTPSDLGEYLFGFVDPTARATSGVIAGFAPFISEPAAGSGMRTHALVVSQRFTNVITDTSGNITGQGRDGLMLREYDQFYFAQDDWRARPNLTFSFGLRYENFGEPINSIRNFNPAGPHVNRDTTDFAPRVGFAWAPSRRWVFRGGYTIQYNPVVLNIPLLIWQNGPISPFVSALGAGAGTLGRPVPSGVFPNQPFSVSDINVRVAGCSRFADFFNPRIGLPALPSRTAAGNVPLVNCSDQERVDPNLKNPYVQNVSLGAQFEFATNWLLEVGYVGSKGTRLFQRIDLNPFGGWNLACAANPPFGVVGQCRNSRLDDTQGGISKVTNGGSSIYHGLQVSVTKRLSHVHGFGDLTLNGAYTWSHMIDNASEIFGPGTRFISSRATDPRSLLVDPLSSAPFESITPFPQVFNKGSKDERGNSSFDRRHRVSVGFLWEPFPTRGIALRGWQLNGVVTAQTGQPFSPLNASPFSTCADANGDGRVGNDRPDIGNAKAPINTVALLRDPRCLDPTQGYVDLNGNPVNPSAVRFVQRPLSSSAGAGGIAGRNILTGPGIVNLDLSLYKNFKFHERYVLQFRWEVYDAFNHPNFGNPIGNAFAVDAQPTPAFAFSATSTAAGISGIIPENAIDAINPVKTNASGQPLHTFLTKQNMNTSNRRMQFGIRFVF